MLIILIALTVAASVTLTAEAGRGADRTGATFSTQVRLRNR